MRLTIKVEYVFGMAACLSLYDADMTLMGMGLPEWSEH